MKIDRMRFLMLASSLSLGGCVVVNEDSNDGGTAGTAGAAGAGTGGSAGSGTGGAGGSAGSSGGAGGSMAGAGGSMAGAGGSMAGAGGSTGGAAGSATGGAAGSTAGAGGSTGGAAGSATGGAAGSGTGGAAGSATGGAAGSGTGGAAGSGTGGAAGSGTGGAAGAAGAGGSGGTCDDSVGSPGSCLDMTGSLCFDWGIPFCNDAAEYYKPAVAEAAVSCMLSLPLDSCTATTDPYSCLRDSLANACADSSADALCAQWVTDCGGSLTDAACHDIVDGFNTAGRAALSTCMSTTCNSTYGLWSCIEVGLPNAPTGTCTDLASSCYSWGLGLCGDATDYMQPDVAAAAVACMAGLMSDTTCTGTETPYTCTASALAGAAADSTADALCTQWVTDCAGTTYGVMTDYECHDLVDGYTTAGRDALSTCMSTTCNGGFGLWSCIEAGLP